MQRSGQTRAAANPLGSALNMTDDAPDCVDGNQQIALQGPPLTISKAKGLLPRNAECRRRGL